MAEKQYNAWINSKFKGLSAHTLLQIISFFIPFDKNYVDEWVYVTLYDYFRGVRSDMCVKCYESTIDLVNQYWNS